MTTLADMLEATTERRAEHEVVVHKSGRMSYGSVFHGACSIARHLRAEGVQPGDRVVMLLRNSASYLVSYFGVLGAGSVAVPLNPSSTAYELEPLVRDCGAKAIICHSSIVAMLPESMPTVTTLVVDGPQPAEQQLGRPVASVAEITGAGAVAELPHRGGPDDLAQIIYTSGTTGKPKGVALTHRSLLANTESIVTYLKLTERDRCTVILPFFYSYGNSLLLTHVRVGGALLLADQFVFLNEVVSRMVEERATGFSGVPSSYAMLLRQSAFPRTKFESLRYVTCAGGALSKSMVQELRACLPGTEIFVMYGQTEASARLSYLEPVDLDRKLGSIGKGMPGIRLRVLGANGVEVSPGEVGEIVAEGESIMQGYWNNPEETAEVLVDGRLYTRDLATVDEDGYIYIVGRSSDMIKSGSYRIHPTEIEEVLNAHPAVLESAVVGVADPVMGETLVAFVVPRSGRSPDSTELLNFAKRSLSPYKLPREVTLLRELPKTTSGKVKRAALRERWKPDHERLSTADRDHD